MDTGAGEQVCGSYDFGHVKLVRGPEGRAEDSDRRTVETLSSSHCGFLLSVSRAESTFHYSGRGTSGSQRLAPVGQPGGQILRRQSGGTLDLTRRGGLFMLQASTHVHPRLLASVTEDEPEVPLDVMDEEMERDLVGRQEPEAPHAVEHRAPR